MCLAWLRKQLSCFKVFLCAMLLTEACAWASAHHSLQVLSLARPLERYYVMSIVDLNGEGSRICRIDK